MRVSCCILPRAHAVAVCDDFLVTATDREVHKNERLFCVNYAPVGSRDIRDHTRNCGYDQRRMEPRAAVQHEHTLVPLVSGPETTTCTDNEHSFENAISHSDIVVQTLRLSMHCSYSFTISCRQI